jgi:hypothetical protein
MTIEEFKIECCKMGMEPPFVDFVMSSDFGSNGRIARREALYLPTRLATVCACDECNERSFVSDERLLSCVQCTTDDAICIACWNANRRSHTQHDHFEVVKPFQLRSVKLYYKHSHDDMWTVAVGDASCRKSSSPWSPVRCCHGSDRGQSHRRHCGLGERLQHKRIKETGRCMCW